MANPRMAASCIKTPDEFVLLEILIPSIALMDLDDQVNGLKRSKTFLTLQTLTPASNRILLNGISRIRDFRLFMMAKRTTHK
jgi:hypothetical protein